MVWFWTILAVSMIGTGISHVTASDIYTVELDIVCDKACNQRIDARGHDTALFLYDVIKETDKRLSTLGVSVVLVAMEIWNKQDKISLYSNLAQVRGEFSQYRAGTLLRRKWSDVSVLVTGREVAGVSSDPNGVMPLGGCCTQYNGAGTLKYTIQNSATLSATLAHEIGHALGINHDSADCCSAGNNKCMMSAVFDSSRIYAPVFSNCSKMEFKHFLSLPQSDCLRDAPGGVYVPPGGDTCGNGVLDDGEQCDCGLGCLRGCCNCCQNCTLIDGATCFRGDCCDTGICRNHEKGYVCRDPVNFQCDKPDSCTGTDTDCTDDTQETGTPCTDGFDGEGYCMQGKCITRNEQCRAEWGLGIYNGNPECYTTGITRPSWFINCGTDSSGYTVSCTTGEANNYQCSMLQCSGTSDMRELSMYKDPQNNFFVEETDCISGKYGVWQSRIGDILVANLSRCGDGLVCFNGDCVPLDIAINGTADEEELFDDGYCGDGLIGDGEECDCGPYQCDCCDPRTCILLNSGSLCLHDECHKCDGQSASCSVTTSSDFSKCDNKSGYCHKGRCVSLHNSCRNVFGDSAMPASSDIYNTNIAENSSQHNGGGYLLYDVTASTWHKTYREFRSSDDDGVCGILLCETSNTAEVTDDKGRKLLSKTFFLRYDDSIRVAYHSMETTRRFGSVYQRYYPVLTETGTPCTTGEGTLGYCESELLALDQRNWNWYWYSMCVSLE